jgi:hypothetical protein
MSNPHFEVRRLDARTLLVVYEASMSSRIEDEMSIDDYNRFVTDESRKIHLIIDDFIVDVMNGVVAAGLAEMTDDVEANSTFPHNGLITKDDALVMHFEQRIVWNFDLPEDTVRVATQDAKDWLQRQK